MVKSTRLNTRINVELYPHERCSMNALHKEENYVDPVCRMKVAADGNVPSFVFQSETYHFCAEGCRRAFMADPKKYLESKPKKHKGIWGRYLDRLNKATGGKPPCCH